MEMVDIVARLERRFDLLIPNNDVGGLTTLGDVTDYVSTRLVENSFRRSAVTAHPSRHLALQDLVPPATERCNGNRFRSAAPSGPPVRVHLENSANSIRFNVMPDRIVEETLYLSEYRVWPRYAEATFNRRYESQMRTVLIISFF